MHRLLVPLAAFCTLALTLSLALTSCGTQSSSALGEAYIAPESTNLRQEVTQKNSTVAVLKHGDRVSIVDVRRRFVKVRTAKGLEGWIDASQLLSPEQMNQILRERQRASTLPSEGAATVYEALNVHIEPSRQSPALARIPDGGSVSVLAHRVEPKLAAAPHSSINFERPQPSLRRQRRERQTKNVFHLPPKPAPPKPPENWQELSAERIDGATSTADLKASRDSQKAVKQIQELKKPEILEDWSEIRTKANQTGWVLSRNLIMSVPDEVAQYAEGKRITSYFDLGAVNDDVKGIKHNWLWTTSSAALPYDFDAWRVFLWNRRRHRYETSYRQHDIEGYFPVQVDVPDSNGSGRVFSLITRDGDGRLWRRSYSFDGSRVHLTAKEEYHPGASPNVSKPASLNMNQLREKSSGPGWFRRHWNAFKRNIGAAD